MQEEDAIIDHQAAVIAELRQQIETLVKRIVQLEDEVARLKRDSSNSSKPPSGDIVISKRQTIMTMASCTGRGVLIRPSTAF